MNIKLACTLFWKTLTDRTFAEQAGSWLNRTEPPAQEPAKAPQGPHRTDAIELLATLQREGRLIDFLQEPLEAYSDTQVGAAVRGIHRDCAQTLTRLFDIQPLQDQPEGAEVTLPNPLDPGQWKLVGQVTANATKGSLCHHGWKATRHELPAWTGAESSAWVLAPAEVEIQ